MNTHLEGELAKLVETILKRYWKKSILLASICNTLDLNLYDI